LVLSAKFAISVGTNRVPVVLPAVFAILKDVGVNLP